MTFQNALAGTAPVRRTLRAISLSLHSGATARYAPWILPKRLGTNHVCVKFKASYPLRKKPRSGRQEVRHAHEAVIDPLNLARHQRVGRANDLTLLQAHQHPANFLV